MLIRLARISDIPQVIEMKKIGDFEKYRKRVELSDQKQASYLVVEEAGDIIANVFLKYFGTERDPDFPNIEDLFVKADKRSQGLGTILLKECERLSLERGFTRIGLSVNPKLNPKALNLYQRLGYQIIQGRDPHLSGIYDGVEDWCLDMVKQLS